MKRHLPVIEDRGVGSLRRDGSRIDIVTADVHGRFHRLRIATFLVLGLIYLSLPWIRIGGHPAVLLDIVHRRFYLFGATFNAQDTWLVFFILSGAAFALVVVAALFGRVWCGYACPQTVFVDGVFRRIERLFEGPRAAHMRRDAGDWTLERIARKTAKHAVYIVVALVLSHVFLSYFVSVPSMFDMMTRSPSEHPEAFGWAFGLGTILYFDFSWFREQFCLVLCPYGRLQSVLGDADTIVVGYDEKRGEPRGKASDPNAGACVDCQRCVVVCPTGIDIRKGQQLDCIGCTACIDACDEIMDSLHRERGLIRYDSPNGFEGKPRRFVRSRLALYGVLMAAGVGAASFAFMHRRPIEANLIRLQGAPYVLDQGNVRNAYELHLVNKRSEPTTFTLETGGPFTYAIPMRTVRLEPLADRRIPIFASLPESQAQPNMRTQLRVRAEGHEEANVDISAPFLSPRGMR